MSLPRSIHLASDAAPRSPRPPFTLLWELAVSPQAALRAKTMPNDLRATRQPPPGRAFAPAMTGEAILGGAVAKLEPNRGGSA